MAPPLGTLSPERVQRRHWRANDVDLEQVIDWLTRLQADLALSEVGAPEHPHPRNCVLNLVVVCTDGRRVAACDRLIGAIAASHPLRAILLVLDDANTRSGVDAEITSEAHRLVAGAPVQREQVVLTIRGQAGEHLASLVEPLLVPDVPTYLWWTGEQRLDHRGLRDALRFCDALIVDSDRFERPIDALLELLRLLESPSPLAGETAGPGRRAGMGFCDMRWTRLGPWRETVAQCFGPAIRHPFLAEIERVEVESAGMVPAALMVGWLASALGWEIGVPTSASPTEVLAAAGRPDGRSIRLALRVRPGADVRLLRLAGGGFALEVEREDHVDTARLSIEMAGMETVRQRLPLPDPDEAQLFARLLYAARRDAAFVRSLTAAAALLDGAR